MSQYKRIINEYYEDLIAKIDIETEQILAKNTDLNHDEINTKRLELIKFLNELNETVVQDFELRPDFHDIVNEDNDNAKRLILNENFCFFIPNDGRKVNFFHEHEPGKLIIINRYLSDRTIDLIREIINGKISNNWLTHYEDDFNTNFETKIISEILLDKSASDEELLLDLTEIEQNQIETLSFRHKFSNINENSFNGIENLINLESLKLLETVVDNDDYINYANWYKNLEWTEILTIGGTCFKKFYNQSFQGLKNLKELNIYQINLESIEPDAFAGLDNLESISFEYSSLEKIDKLDLSSLKILKNLVFIKNEIINFKSDWVVSASLKKLAICENNISVMEGLKDVKNLETLIITDNGTSTTRFPKPKLHDRFFSDVENLEILCLEESYLEKIEPVMFELMFNLKFLSLRSNSLLSQDSAVFNNFASLEFLDLSRNGALVLDFDTLLLPSLKFLTIQHKTFPNLTSMPQLQGIDITGVEELPENMFNLPNTLDFVKIEIRYNQKFTENHFIGLSNLEFLKIGFFEYSNRQKRSVEFDTRKYHDEITVLMEGLVFNVTEKTRFQKGYFNKNGDLESESDYFRDMLIVSPNIKEFVLHKYNHYKNLK